MKYRSAITGKFVTRTFAMRHPKTTVAEGKRNRGKGAKKLGRWTQARPLKRRKRK